MILLASECPGCGRIRTEDLKVLIFLQTNETLVLIHRTPMQSLDQETLEIVTASNFSALRFSQFSQSCSTEFKSRPYLKNFFFHMVTRLMPPLRYMIKNVNERCNILAVPNSKLFKIAKHYLI